MEPNHNYVKLPESVPVETSVACHVQRSPPSKEVVVEVIDSAGVTIIIIQPECCLPRIVVRTK